MLSHSSERIFNPCRYAGCIYLNVLPSCSAFTACSEVNFCHFAFMMEENMKLCTMPFYNIYIHEKLWGKGLLHSNPLPPPTSFRDFFEKLEKQKKSQIWSYSFMICRKVVRNVILNNIHLHNQLSRMHGSLTRVTKKFQIEEKSKIWRIWRRYFRFDHRVFYSR